MLDAMFITGFVSFSTVESNRSNSRIHTVDIFARFSHKYNKKQITHTTFATYPAFITDSFIYRFFERHCEIEFYSFPSE